MGRIGMLLAIALAVLVAGCGGGGQEESTGPTAAGPNARVSQQTPTETTATPPPIARPPDLVMSTGSSEVVAGVGTYCWSDGGAGACVDTIGIITSAEALVATGPFPLVGALRPAPRDNAIEDARATAWRVDDRCVDDPRVSGSTACGPVPVDDGFAFPFGLGEGTDLSVSIDEDGLRVTPPAASGTYVIGMSLTFEGGDVQYGVLLTLLPSEG